MIIAARDKGGGWVEGSESVGYGGNCSAGIRYSKHMQHRDQ